MLKPIPALDLIDGRVVRLRQGDFDRQTTYDATPLELAKSWEAAGCTALHLVDLDAARTGSTANLGVLRTLRAQTGLQLQWGGGIRSMEVAGRVAEAGADRLVIGTLAVTDPETTLRIAERIGPEATVIGADVHNGRIATHGWQSTAEVTLPDLVGQYLVADVRRFLVTDVAQDGMLSGPAVALYQALLRAQPQVQLIASGGIRSAADLRTLEAAGVQEAVIGRALLEGKLTPEELVSC